MRKMLGKCCGLWLGLMTCLLQGGYCPCAASDNAVYRSDVFTNGSDLAFDRWVVDISVFELGLVLKNRKDHWIVAEFGAHPKTPAYSVEVDGQGKLSVRPPNVFTVEGSFSVLVDLMGKSLKKEGAYHWNAPNLGVIRAGNGPVNDPPEDRSGYDELDAMFSPLLSGGTVICKTDDAEKSEAAALRPVYLIPSDWAGFVEPALKYFESNPSLLEIALAGENERELTQGLTHENPFIAVSACRVLAKAGILRPEVRKKAVRETVGLRQAVFVFLMVKNSRDSTQKAIVQELCDIVAESKRADEIWGLAFTVVSKGSFQTPFDVIPIIDALLAKVAGWNTAGQADKNLELILRGRATYLKQIKRVKSKFEAMDRPAEDFRQKEITAILAPGRVANSKDEDGTPILMVAIQRGYVDAIKELIQRGADVRAGDRSGNTPFSDAAVLGNTEILQLLLDKGGSVNGRFGSNWTPLMNAACFGRLEAAQFLLDKGADVKPANDNGNTALTLAAASFPEIVKLLLAQKAEVNHATKAGKTALMVAAEKRQIESVKILLASGALTDVKDKDGETALSIAEKKGFTEIVEVLKNWKPARAGAVVKPPS